MTRYYISNGKCGSETVFKMIGAKWKPWIIYLCHTEKGCTFGRLKQAMAPVSDGTLASQINALVEDELLVKESAADTGKTQYFITEKTEELFPVMMDLVGFAKLYGVQTNELESYLEHSRKMIGTKWKSRIIWLIHNTETIRFNELQNSIEGISHKMLAQQLTEMEKDQLIIRKDYQEKNPKVEYSLTMQGEEAYKIIKGMTEFCIKYGLLKPRISIDY